MTGRGQAWLRGTAALLIGAGLVSWAGRAREHALELGPPRLWRLSAETEQVLASLQEPLLATLFVSRPSTMPATLRRMEPDLLTLLRRMEEASDGWFLVQVSHPDQDPAQQALAAQAGVAPFRATGILRDDYREQEVWCGLVVERARGAPLVLPALEPAHLPLVQDRVRAWLTGGDGPGPMLGLLAPTEYRQLREHLAQFGSLRELTPAALAHTDTDLVLWLAPEVVTDEARLAIRGLLEAGRSVVLAPAPRTVTPLDDGWSRLRFAASGDATLEALLRDHGLERRPDLVLDRLCGGANDADGAPIPLPFRVRCIAPHQDFREYRLEPNGHLWFEAPAALWPLPGQTADPDLRQQVLAATSDQTWLHPWPEAPLAREELELGVPSARQPLIVQVDRPEDPLHGSLVVLADSGPFTDAGLTRPEAAHGRLLESLVRTLGAEERLAWARARPRPERLPRMTAPTRRGWRLFVLASLPLLLVAYGAWRTRGGVDWRAWPSPRPWLPLLGAGLSFALLWLLVGQALRRWEPRLDLTQEGRHDPGRITRQLARGDGSPLVVDWFLSAPERLPARLRLPVQSLSRLLRDLASAGAPLTLVVTDPSEQSAAEQAALIRQGIQPCWSRDELDAAGARDVFHCTLRLRRHEREVLLPFAEPREFESAAFRLAFALWRLQEGREVTVAFASDTPRPSAAEAYEEYQTKGLMPPAGTDVYQRARRTLERAGFTVRHVNPRDPSLPPDVDALVWLQPRRDVRPMLDQAAAYLHQGGRLLLAAQPFRMQARQYPGAGFEEVYWPEPQHPDVDRSWLPELGLQLQREVLCDRLATLQELDARLHGRGPRREFSSQPSALPFQLRGSSAYASSSSPITRHLGDQAFTGATWLGLDPERLAAAGLRAEVLWTTSPKAWSFRWEKGWLPPEVLAGKGESRGLAPLMVQVEGSFPLPGPPEPQAAGDPVTPGPGRLLLLGCSEVFRDESLARPGYRGDRLLVACVAGLTLPDALTGLAGRARVDRGFGLVPARERLWWRASVTGFAPLLLVLIALWRRSSR